MGGTPWKRGRKQEAWRERVAWPAPPPGALEGLLRGACGGLSWPGFLPVFISNQVCQPRTVGSWGPPALCCGAVFCIARCQQYPCPQPTRCQHHPLPSCDHQKCLQTVPNIPGTGVANGPVQNPWVITGGSVSTGGGSAAAADPTGLGAGGMH